MSWPSSSLRFIKPGGKYSLIISIYHKGHNGLELFHAFNYFCISECPSRYPLSDSVFDSPIMIEDYPESLSQAQRCVYVIPG